MIAVDTNVLLRALISDSEAIDQSRAARALLEQSDRVRVSTIVFAETLWVLAKRYGMTRAQLVQVANDLLAHERIEIQNRDLLLAAVDDYGNETNDFADALALADARSNGVVLHTFDRRLAKLEGAALVNAG